MLYNQNQEIFGNLRSSQVRIDELSAEVVAKKDKNRALEAKLRRVGEEYRATTDHIIVEHRASMVSSE